MSRKLHYFDINGLAEGIRFMLHYGNLEFEDVRYQRDEWPAKKDKFPFGQLPIYEEAGKGSLNQSIAIARYIGQTLDLTGGNPWDDAQIDAIVLTLYDFWFKSRDTVLKAVQGGDNAAETAKLNTEVIPFYFGKFDQIIKDNNGFLHKKLSWADFVLAGLIDAHNLFHKSQLQDGYPHVKKLVEKVHSYPGVKKYVSARKPYVNPFDKK